VRRVFALVLLLAAPALAACGGGNDSQNAKTSSTTPTAATGATGVAKNKSGATGKAKSNAKSRAKSRSKNKAGAGTSNGTGGSKKPRSGTRKNRQKAAPTNTNTTPVKKVPPRSGKLPTTDKGSYSVARTVCGGYVAETLKGKKLTDLAKDYSRAWPSDRRQAAYDGCLAGLKQPRIPGSDEY
jgi:hypothetical protein